MATINRKFYQSRRGPAPSDQRIVVGWCSSNPRPGICWCATNGRVPGMMAATSSNWRNSCCRKADAQTALVDSLFRVPVDAQA